MKTKLCKKEIKKGKKIMKKVWDKFGGIWQENKHLIIIQNAGGSVYVEFKFEYDEYTESDFAVIQVYNTDSIIGKDIQKFIDELENENISECEIILNKPTEGEIYV